MYEKILLVEDRQDTLILLAFALNKTGYSVLEADNGEKALEIIKEKNVDAVILDVLLPGIDGGEVLKRMRADSGNDNIKVIMLTASKVTEDEQKKFNELGANGFLLKPIKIAAIRQELERVLGAGEKKKEG